MVLQTTLPARILPTVQQEMQTVLKYRYIHFGKGSMIDTFSTADVAAANKQAKASADCGFSLQTGARPKNQCLPNTKKNGPTSLWSKVLTLWSEPIRMCSQPYGYLTDDSGHNMLIYYSLGNFVTGQGNTEAASWRNGSLYHSEDRRRRSDQASRSRMPHWHRWLCITATIPRNMHHISRTIIRTLLAAHSVRQSIGDEFSLENLQTKYDEIMSMNVTPFTFDSDGNMPIPTEITWRIMIPSPPPGTPGTDIRDWWQFRRLNVTVHR